MQRLVCVTKSSHCTISKLTARLFTRHTAGITSGKNGVPGEQITLFLLNSFLRSGSYSMIKVKDYKNDVERITNLGVMIMKLQGICLGLRKPVKIDCHGVYYHESKDITV
jgi:hypothetical protein